MQEMLITIASLFGIALFNYVATKLFEVISGQSKNFFWKDTREDKLTYLKSHLQFEELKKRTRIVVVDDEEGFPIELFQNEGYSIDKWNNVKDYGKLESGFFDIIILDIKGVAKHISSEDGLGVLESIKKRNPAQIIIAFSQHSYDLSKSRFWELADEKIAKPSDFLKIKNIIDNLINTKFKPARYIETLHKTLQNNNVSPKEIRNIEKEIVHAIKDKKEPELSKYLAYKENHVELMGKIITLSNTILKFF